MNPELQALKAEIQEIRATVSNLEIAYREHEHGGHDSRSIKLSSVFIDMPRKLDESGIFQVVSAAPTTAPLDPYDQVQVYVNGATLRLYWYDWNADVWHYVTATA